jgi:hypothetical protein
MKNFTKTQRILFSVGILLGCGVPHYFFGNVYPDFFDFLQGLGIGILLVILFSKVCLKFKKREQYE